ncbi:hypothetical protein [Bifidobacterium biavatii]|uniref:Uncharacterized protein n=1 Tax=Bifidobacterium biavatii DSM 23969 TaxID=1437608 RepID=A0A086ZDA0_9BIFI|nr:hypothetical protein [Bifidobacterium biavatii]KFI44500.1 hypothetical protein BBIA_2408 [Bifidobacterium biavatii DSM 23969]
MWFLARIVSFWPAFLEVMFSTCLGDLFVCGVLLPVSLALVLLPFAQSRVRRALLVFLFFTAWGFALLVLAVGGLLVVGGR